MPDPLESRDVAGNAYDDKRPSENAIINAH